MTGKILLISGPSGSGKSTLINRLIEDDGENIYFSISNTTRKPREGEINGINYHFVSESNFKDDIKNNLFLEWALVHNNYYGTSIRSVKNAFEEDKTVILDIDVQGFYLAKKIFKDEITSVFITTPTKSKLEQRLLNRGSDDKETIENRVKNAEEEMCHIKNYDYFLINKDLDKTYKKLKAIYKLMKCKTNYVDSDEIISKWIS